METGKAIALAGIIATAVVGVAGTASSWLTARDDRESQRAIAHDERVYDRRADAYIDGTRLLVSIGNAWSKLLHRNKSVHSAQTAHAVARAAHKLHRRLKAAENLLRPRIVAYGSDAGYEAWAAAVGWLDTGTSEVEREPGFETYPDLKTVRNAVNKFARIVHRELD